MKIAKVAAERKRELESAIRKSDSDRRIVGRNRDALIGDGKVDIHVNVETLYNPLSLPGQRQLDSALYEFIEEATNLLAYLVPIRLVLHGVPREAQADVPKIVRQHYEARLQDHLWDKRTNTLKTIVFSIFGVVVLALYLALAITREDTVTLEILSVVGSFSLWEAADCYLLERRDIHQDMLNTAQLMTMEIAFED